MTENFLTVAPGFRLHYMVDDYTDPWTTPQTILMVHGFAESGEAWRAWVPHLARHYRVVRFDMRGYGQSTPMAADYAWTMEMLLGDISAVADHLGARHFHLIGAKSGGSLVLQYAVHEPQRVMSVIAVTPPVVAAAGVSDWQKQIAAEGVVPWARTTMPGRLGTKARPEELEWWTQNIQGKTPVSTLIGYLNWVPGLDLREQVLRISQPTLIITTTGSGLRTVDSVKEWQGKMRDAELRVLEGDAWHPAAAYPDVCAQAAAEFLARRHPT
ncbi:MAG TPA: alpha/beta hydrolase [Burkholderiales bacterium]|jgi:pimeloyl-ACP methyl ester carboxylesterase